VKGEKKNRRIIMVEGTGREEYFKQKEKEVEEGWRNRRRRREGEKGGG
jgi:hypothetical protein